jgi:hypothetical protein
MRVVAYILFTLVFDLIVSTVSSTSSEKCGASAGDAEPSSGTMLLQISEASSHQASADRVGVAKVDLVQSSGLESSEDMVSSGGVQGVKAWTVDDAAETPRERYHVAPQISLMMSRGARKHRAMDRSEINEDEDEAIEETNKKTRRHKSAEISVIGSDQALKAKRRKTSLAALSEIREADRQSLDEEGYSQVASTVSNRMMERFIERAISDLNLEVVDTGGLKGLVPYYSGQKDIQTFEALQEELLNTAEQPDSWLTKKTDRPEENNLLQMGAQVGTIKAKRIKHVDQELSLLEHASATVRRAAHKVPDLANYLFGSQTVVMLCMVGFIAALFCLHEHNERKRVAKGFLFEDPLNMSPTPPSAKEDPSLAASLKALRAQKTVH